MALLSNLFFYGQFKGDIFYIKEEPLSKNKALMLVPLEKYRYQIYSVENMEIEFNIKYGKNCMAVYILDQYSGVCINSSGNDDSNSNLFLSHPQVIFFKPWMLALDSNWKWSAGYADRQTDTLYSNYSFEVIGEEKIFGRDSFIVEIKSPEMNSKQWIDKQKRVLLKEETNTYSILILEAPFGLSNSSQN